MLWKHNRKPHYIYQLNPPLEKWIINILNDINAELASFGLPEGFKALKKVIKFEIDSERNEKLKRLIGAIVNSESRNVQKLRSTLNYLKTKNYQVDINELKNV